MSEKLFESIKRIIESGMYDKAELEAKIEKLQHSGRLTENEASELMILINNQ